MTGSTTRPNSTIRSGSMPNLSGGRIDLSYTGKQQVQLARLRVKRQKNLVMRLRALGRNTEQDERLLLSLEELLVELTRHREQELRTLYRHD